MIKEKPQSRPLSLSQKRRVLMESGEYGEVVHALYHGGSQPGTKREIGPLALVGCGAVRAWCLLTGTIKTYRLESLEIVDENTDAPLYDPGNGPRAIPSGAVMTRRLRWSETDYLRYQERAKPPSARTKRKTKNGMPQEILFKAVETRWPGRFESEATGLVPGRRFSADLCDRRRRAIIECDGWSFHGRFKAAFLRDREKDYLLTINAWRILRVPAGLIVKDLPAAMQRVKHFVSMLDREYSNRTRRTRVPRKSKVPATRKRSEV